MTSAGLQAVIGGARRAAALMLAHGLGYKSVHQSTHYIRALSGQSFAMSTT